MGSAAAQKPIAVLVVSAWHEGAPARLAARITYTRDVRDSERVTVTAAGLDEIDAVFRRWLHEVDASRVPGDAPVTDE